MNKRLILSLMAAFFCSFRGGGAFADIHDFFESSCGSEIGEATGLRSEAIGQQVSSVLEFAREPFARPDLQELPDDVLTEVRGFHLTDQCGTEAELRRINEYVNGLRVKGRLTYQSPEEGSVPNSAKLNTWFTAAQSLFIEAGSCEEFSLLYYAILRNLGCPDSRMAVRSFYDPQLGGHAQLLVQGTDDQIYALDLDIQRFRRIDIRPIPALIVANKSLQSACTP